MKYIALIIGLLVVGCGKQEQADSGGTPAPPTPTTTEKPVKELTAEEKVVGEYEFKDDKDTRFRMRVLENGVLESNIKDKQREEDFKWSISEDGELHVEVGDGIILVFRINKDGSITAVARIDKDGRDDKPKEKQRTFKKIK